MENNLSPKLRFPEFQDNWKESKLSQIAKFSKGKGISKSDIDENGEIECVRYGELYTHYKETINEVKSKTNLSKEELIFSEENDVIIPASGETQLDIATASCVTRSGIALGGDLNIIKSKANGVFLSYYLNSKKKIDIAKLAQGISVVHLYSSQLGLLKINLPNTEEQQKIASFLTSVDERLTLLAQQKEKLELYKKGVMQQIFAQKLRFKDENGNNYPDWEEKKLGELCKKAQSGGTPKSTVKEYYDGEIPFLAISDMTVQGKYLNRTSRFVSMKGIENSSSWIVPENSLIYSMYASVGFVSINKIKIATSQAVMNIILKENINLEFVYYSLLNLQNQIYKFVETGTQGNINAQIVKNLDINLPYIEEQQKIASFLSAIDVQIEGVSKKIEQTKLFKKGLLQQMFV